MNYGLRHFGNDVMQLSYRRIWREFGSALPFQTRLTQIKPDLPLSNEHGSQVKDQGRRQCCHNKHKKFPIGLQVMYLYFPDTPRITKQEVNEFSWQYNKNARFVSNLKAFFLLQNVVILKCTTGTKAGRIVWGVTK
jgi:hypothetical protein